MRFEIKEKGSRNFYEEVLYLSLIRKDVLKNKKYKMYKISDYHKRYIIFAGISILLMFIFYLLFKNGLFLMFAGMMLLILAYEILSMNNFNKYIDAALSQDANRVVEINEDGVFYADGNKDLRLNWDGIHSVVIGKYSISFFPKIETDYIISLESKYKDSVSDCVKQYGKAELLISKES